MSPRDFLIRAARTSYRLIMRKRFLNPACNINREEANDKIYEMLVGLSPCMISRFGTTELNCVNNYLCIQSNKSYTRKVLEYIKENTHTPWWNTDHFKYMRLYSGVFPVNEDVCNKFSVRYLSDIPLIDLLGSFQYYEKFMPLNPFVNKFQLETLYPFFVQNPWTRALNGKKVLVVHPFDQTIQSQYLKRNFLFENNQILPDFELKTIKAVQSIGGANVNFNDWFEALNYMEDIISGIEFDICILGCGAYGLPLAAHVKRIGKKAVHLGGGTQLLFGIKGSRWENVGLYNGFHEYRPNEFLYTNYKSMFNKYWVRPNISETPLNSNDVEGGCYW